MFKTKFPSDSISMDQKLLTEVSKSEGVDTLARMLSARSTAIYETKRWCVDSVQSQINLLEGWAKKFEDNPDMAPIGFGGKANADAAAVKFGIEVLKELFDSIQNSKDVYR